MPVDVRAVGEETGGGGDVGVAIPAEVHRPATTVAVTTGVDHDDTEPVAGEDGRLVEDVGPRRPGAMQQHHRGTVRGRQVPSGQAHTVIRGQHHGFIAEALARRRRPDLRSWDVRRRDGRRHDEPDDNGDHQCAQAGSDPPDAALAASADHRAGRGEGETGDHRDRAGDGLNRPTVFDDIGDEPRSDGEDNDTDAHGQPAASPIAEARLQSDHRKCEDGDAYDSCELPAGGSVMTDEHGHRDTADGCRHGNAAVAELGPMHTVDEARRACALRDDCHVNPLRLRSACAAAVSAERGERPDVPRSMWRVSTTGCRLCSARRAAGCSARDATQHAA